MKIVRFQLDDETARVGCQEGENIVELATDDPLTAPGAARIAHHRLADVRLLAPINRPPKYLAVGLNYALHSAEAGFDLPKYPRIFNKQATCITGPGDAIHMPDFTDTLDYEGELGIVIGSACRNVPEEHALGVVAGYVVLNDVSVREWQHRSPTITLAKSADTHGPVGPWLVTADEVPDPQNLRVRTRVGDEILQDFRTNDMLYSIRHVISVLSHIFTLEPGDLIATGTGDGVGIARAPQRWLRIGESVTVEIEGLGSLTNPVVAQPANLAYWTAWPSRGQPA